MTLMRKMMNTPEEAKAELAELGYTLTIRKQQRCHHGRIYQKPEKGKRVDLQIGATLTDDQRALHPELCDWLDRNAIAKGSSLVVFSAARLAA